MMQKIWWKSKLNNRVDPDILYFALTFDTDSDPKKSLQDPSWKNLEYFDFIYNSLTEWFLTNLNEKPITTWFVRADEQVKDVYGNYDGLFTNFYPNWMKILNDGGEVGIHPHLYLKKGNKYIRTYEKEFFKKYLNDIFKTLSNNKKISIKSSRIGEAFQSNAIMSILDKFNIKQDCTAMSSRFVNTKERKIDWRSTPKEPYYPSKIDYRKTGDLNFQLLEIPMTMVQTRAPYDASIYFRYLNPGFHSECFIDLEENIKNLNYIMTITHPYEIVPMNNNEHGLISYSMDNFLENLTKILNICKKNKRKIVFLNTNELGNIYRGC